MALASLGTFLRTALCGLASLASLAAISSLHAQQGARHAFPLPGIPSSPADRDYRLEVSDGTQRIQPLTAAQLAQPSALNCTSYCGTTVNYTSWKNNNYVMQQFDGLYVRVLVPQDWFGLPTFSENLRHVFINGFDLVYQYLYEIVGKRPGAALDTIAYVNPPGCGDGCGTVGGLGVELGWDSSDASIAYDGLEGYGEIHELTHNFDAYGGSYKFAALPDSSHYWTTMLRAIYTFSANRNFRYYHEYEGWLQSYLDLGNANGWQECVLQSTCSGDGNGYSAPVGLFFRLAHLYGQASVGRWIDFIKNHQSSPTDQDKLDHFFEAYSAAANRNVNCVFDELHWPISNAVRAWVDTNIGTTAQNPDCAIGAHGKSAILDMIAEFAPPATPNNYTGAGGGVWSPHTVGFPGTVNGTGSAADQSFTFQWSVGQEVLIYVCSPAGGHTGETRFWYFYPTYASISGGPSFTPGTCNTSTRTVPADGIPMAINVKAASDQGAFSVVAVPAQSPVQPRDWARLSVTRNTSTGVFTMTVNQIDRNKVTPTSAIFGGPQAVRFWVQNAGWVAQVPWSNASSFSATWTPPVGENGDGLVFGAQVLAATSPVNEGYASGMSNLIVFRADGIFANGFEF